MKHSLRRITVALLLCAVLLISLTGCGDKDEEASSTVGSTGVTINVYNWGQYISDGTDGYIDVNKAFTEATGIGVNYMTFDSNETMYTKLKTGGSSYDIIIPSDYMVGRLIQEGMLKELNFDNIPNYQYVGEAYKNTAYDPDNRYSVPYTWGTMGVIYNTKFVDEADIGSWDLLWNEKYSGKILMFDNPRDAFGVAELLQGSSLNTTSSAELQSACDLLVAQKPVVQAYVMDQIYDKMEHEEAWVAAYYAGDFLQMQVENEDLAFYHPVEGFNLFIDAICIPTSSEHQAEAEAYINFLCDPQVSAENLDYLGYSTPIDEARQYMDPEMAASPVAYPDDSVLARGEAYLNLPASATQEMDSLWLNVKTSGGGSTLIICIVGLVVVAAVCVFFVLKKKNRKKARRSMSK